MTTMCTPASGTHMIVPSSPVSRPSPPGGRLPALTPAAGGTGQHRSGAGSKEDQQTKIRLTEVSTVWGDCQTLSAGAVNDAEVSAGYRER
jgi:hypothetical protein